MIAEEKFDCHYQEKGLLFLYKTEEAFSGGKHEGELMQKYCIPVSVYDKGQRHEVEPAALEDVIGGVHFTGDLHMNRFISQNAQRPSPRDGADMSMRIRLSLDLNWRREKFGL